MMLELISADAARFAVAAVSCAALFLLSFSLVTYRGALGWEWRLVLWAVCTQQAVVSYVSVSRARSTPPGFPEAGVDPELLAFLLSAIALLFTLVAASVASHHERDRSRE